MKKLTLDIKDKELITWVKNYARSNNTSLSSLFESHIKALKEFDKKFVKLSPQLENLRDPSRRPKEKGIEKHLVQKRKNP